MGNSVFKAIISYLMLISCFVTGNGLFEMGFTFYWYYFLYILFLLVCIFVFGKIDKGILVTLIAILIYSFATSQYSVDLVMKQIIAITFITLVFYNFIVFENYQIDKIFEKYVKVCKVLGLIGVIQVAAFSLDEINIPAGRYFLNVFWYLKETNISFRFQSLLSEPSFFAYTFSPVVFLAIYNLVSGTKYQFGRSWSIFFIVCYLLTFSLIAYVGVLIMLVIILARKFSTRRIFLPLLSVAVMIGILWTIFSTSELLSNKLQETTKGFTNDITVNEFYKELNLTSYAFLSNWYVTKTSFSEHPVFGTGIGTYEFTYDRILPDEMKEYSTLNRKDACSMTFRILTETGIVGLFFFGLMLFKFSISNQDVCSERTQFLWIINKGILVMIILLLIRSGDYIAIGRVLFLLIYYYTYKIAKHEKDNSGVSNFAA